VQIAEGEALATRRQDQWKYNEPAELKAKSRFHPRRIVGKIVGGVSAYVRLMEDNFGARFMIMLLSVYVIPPPVVAHTT
jgi:hypothetical protein